MTCHALNLVWRSHNRNADVSAVIWFTDGADIVEIGGGRVGRESERVVVRVKGRECGRFQGGQRAQGCMS